MSFPSPHHGSGGSASGGITPTSPPSSSAAISSSSSRAVVLPASRQGPAGLPRSTPCHPLPAEGDHQLEKLEFALAIALTRGDAQRSRQLREEIDRLGGNREEPGT
jgi:hypothetical protein